MKKDILQNGNVENTPIKNEMNRRKFVGLAATAAAAFTIVPRHVLGGKNFVAPSDKITLAYIGIGTQGIRELLPLLAVPQIQVVAVCDPNKEARGYRDWGKDYLRAEIRKAIQKPDWDCGGDGLIPGGRDNGKSIVDTYYANVRPELNYKGCASYEDVRELFDKEKNIDAVKIMTPDHLHGILSMAAIKRGKHVLVHNWTNRPVWPQYPELPKNTADIPAGFNWDLWLGPEAQRPYSPDYTNMVFRGWYDFGGGSMADMGHYSLWTVFNALKLTSPTVVIPNRSHVCSFNGPLPFRIKNDFSFPMASMVRFKYPENANRPPVDLCWYDGGMRPPIPEELFNANKELPEEGMMFVGTKGKILAGFNVQDPQIISGTKMEAPKTNTDKRDQVAQTSAALPLFVDACKTGKQYPGNFSEAEYLTEAVNLYAVALRANKLLRYDAANLKITNVQDANKYLSREYRSGWSPDSI